MATCLSIPPTGLRRAPQPTGSCRGYSYRVTAQRTIAVTWPRGLLGYSTELGLRYPRIPTAHGYRTEVTLYRIFGAELPTDVADWLAGEIVGPLQAELDGAVK